MGTGGTLYLSNQLKTKLTSQVIDTTCMYSDGEDQSHLEYFNCQLDPSGSVGPQYIEANGNVLRGCSATQSSFSLALSTVDDNGGPLGVGHISFDLGSGAYNTGVVSNSCPQQIVASIDSSRHISVTARPVPPVVLFANSWLWANMGGIQDQLTLPAVSLGPLSFGAGALQGLDQITAIDGEVNTAADGTIELGLSMSVPQLLTEASLSFDGSGPVQGGIQLSDARLTASVTVTINPSIAIVMSKISLTGGQVSLNAGGLPIPIFLLTGLLQLVESAFDTDPIQSAVLDAINEHLPGHS